MNISSLDHRKLAMAKSVHSGGARAGQDIALKQKEAKQTPVVVSAPPFGKPAPSKPTVKPSPVKKTVNSVNNTPARPPFPVKKPPTPVNTVKPVKNEPLKAAESTNATAVVKSTPPTKNTITVKSVTQINGDPSVKAAVTVAKTAPKSTPASNEAVKTIPPPATKVTTLTKSDMTKTPSEKVTPAAPAEKVTPAAKTIAEKVIPAGIIAAEKDIPAAKAVADKITPAAKTPAEKDTPAAKTAAEKVIPAAKTPPEKVTPATNTAVVEVIPSAEKPAETPVPTIPDSNVDASPVAEPAVIKKDSENDDTKTKEARKPAGPEPKPLSRITPEISRALAEELDDIMMKIWQKLPDEKHSDADRVVIKVCKDEAADKLREMFTSNIKQRLLHVHNDLYMNVSLDRRPRCSSSKWVSTFTKKFGVVRTRKMSYDQSTFVAELPTFGHFDRLFAFNGAKLGGVRVSLTPIYNFTRVPDDLEKLERRASTKLNMSPRRHDSSKGDESMVEDIDDESLDLFSLLKEGIVLDECVGSEDELM